MRRKSRYSLRYLNGNFCSYCASYISYKTSSCKYWLKLFPKYFKCELKLTREYKNTFISEGTHNESGLVRNNGAGQLPKESGSKKQEPWFSRKFLGAITKWEIRAERLIKPGVQQGVP